MPYSRNSSLPQAVRSLPEEGQTAYRKAFNAAFAEYHDESKAHATAWATVKKLCEKGPDGKWLMKDEMDNVRDPVKFKKVNLEFKQEVIGKLDERRLVFLWMSVAKKDGAVVIDKQGDEIDEADLEEAVYEFMEDIRTAKVMHTGEAVGKHIGGLVFTSELQQALGVEMDRVGWLSVVKVDNDSAWQRVKSGELSMGSIAGHAEREVLADAKT